MKWLLYALAGIGGLLALAVVVLLVMGGMRGESTLVASVDIAQAAADGVHVDLTDPAENQVLGRLACRHSRPHPGADRRRRRSEVWVMEDRNNGNQRMDIESQVTRYEQDALLEATAERAARGSPATVTLRAAADRRQPHAAHLHGVVQVRPLARQAARAGDLALGPAEARGRSRTSQAAGRSASRRERCAKGDFLGEFEQLVLLALLRLGDEAYGMTVRREIEERAARDVSIGAVYATLDRLEEKGLVKSRLGEPHG